jgi:RNA polymerase sigma-70 factor (ECF subfamily)
LQDVPAAVLSATPRLRAAAPPPAGQLVSVGPDVTDRHLRDAEPRDFAALYEAWFDDVARWLRALGAPAADVEDLAQEVFLVVRRRLVDFDHQNVAGWLFRIASRQVVAHRRRKWFKSIVSRPPDVDLDDLPHGAASPAEALESKQRQQLLARLLARMSDRRRATFVLFEVEGYSGEEIARLQGIPVATVWTRLHHARKEFLALVEELRPAEEDR